LDSFHRKEKVIMELKRFGISPSGSSTWFHGFTLNPGIIRIAQERNIRSVGNNPHNYIMWYSIDIGIPSNNHVSIIRSTVFFRKQHARVTISRYPTTILWARNYDLYLRTFVTRVNPVRNANRFICSALGILT